MLISLRIEDKIIVLDFCTFFVLVVGVTYFGTLLCDET